MKLRLKNMLFGIGLVLLVSMSGCAKQDAGETEVEDLVNPSDNDASDTSTLLRELRPLAEQGDARVQYILGGMYDTGDLNSRLSGDTGEG